MIGKKDTASGAVQRMCPNEPIREEVKNTAFLLKVAKRDHSSQGLESQASNQKNSTGSSCVSSAEKCMVLLVTWKKNSYLLRRGGCNFPALRLCVVSSEQDRADTTLPGWSPHIHLGMTPVPVMVYSFSIGSSQNNTMRKRFKRTNLFRVYQKLTHRMPSFVLYYVGWKYLYKLSFH